MLFPAGVPGEEHLKDGLDSCTYGSEHDTHGCTVPDGIQGEVIPLTDENHGEACEERDCGADEVTTGCFFGHVYKGYYPLIILSVFLNPLLQVRKVVDLLGETHIHYLVFPFLDYLPYGERYFTELVSSEDNLPILIAVYILLQEDEHTYTV